MDNKQIFDDNTPINPADSNGLISPDSNIENAEPLPLPPAPENLKAQALSACCVSLSWSKSANATGYILYRSESQEGPYQQIGTASGISFQDCCLCPGTVYYYKIAAYNARGTGPQAGPVSVTTLEANPPCPPCPPPCFPCEPCDYCGGWPCCCRQM